jgi:hypothetical protein
MAEPFSDADVELVTAIIDDRLIRAEARARAILTALAGRILPPGVVLTEQFGHDWGGGILGVCRGEPCLAPVTHRRWVAKGPWEVGAVTDPTTSTTTSVWSAEVIAAAKAEGRTDAEATAHRLQAELSTVRARLGEVLAQLDAARADRDALLDLRDKARELPTDYLLGLAADAVFVQTEDKRRIFWQSVLDEVKAFDAAVDALGDVTPRSET